MNVLSLFDGISCGHVALERAGFPIDNYYASEIDKYAISVTQKNYPETIQLGDVKNWKNWELPEIDLLIGGSPCQGFSFAGKQLNFEDSRSKLFFEYVKVLQVLKPKWFLLENVKMKKEYRDIITNHLGVEPIEINSSLVSAQRRKRLYWTNIPDIIQPTDKEILLKDIVHENFNELIFDVEPFNVNPSGRGMGGVVSNLSKKHPTITANKGDAPKIAIPLSQYLIPFDKTLQILDKEVDRGKLRVREATKKGYVDIEPGECVDLTFPNSKTRRGRRMKDKSNCLTATTQKLCKFGYCRVYYVHGKAVSLADGCYSNDSKDFNRGLLPNKSRCLKSGKHDASVCIKRSDYLFGCITPDRVNKRQNGQRFNEGRKFYTLTAQDRHGVLIEGYIRKLTPIECERLQTLPDGYTEGVSNTQRYKALGNGWTVDVISHIFSHIKKD